MGNDSWLGVSTQHTLRFFFEQLGDVADEPVRPRAEFLYNASVLAHYATTSTALSGAALPAPASLSTVFDTFVLDRSQQTDPDLLESAAAQCLLLTGFFEAQQRQRHNIRWYADLGAEFYAAAGRRHRHRTRARMMWTMAEHFDHWRRTHARLAAHLRDTPALSIGRVA